MQLFSALLVALAATTVHAAYKTQTKPFYLQIVSENATLNGQWIYACHEGAAIEGLCPGRGPKSQAETYRLNYTASDPPPREGYLVWQLAGSGFALWEPLTLKISWESNVAMALFYPNSDLTVGFKQDGGYMYILGYQDDTQVPPVSVTKKYERWYVCQTHYGYLYHTLVWVMGNQEPQNPTCEPVRVKRIWA